MPATTGTLRSRLERTGIRRTGGPRDGFRYRRTNGALVVKAERARLAALRIPPAWRYVSISRKANARLQAVGLDSAGRWQYLYRASYSARRASTKFGRLVSFARALPALRVALRRDLALPGMPLPRSCAIALLLLMACPLRTGNRAYARNNGTFGIATLRPRHIKATGGSVHLRFRGKHGIPQEHVLHSPRLAKLVRQLLRAKRVELFHYTSASGKPHDLTNEQLNGYVQHAMGARFTAKDFRTWGATLLCAGLLRTSRHARCEQAIAPSIAATARWLGNTPSVARESYIHPRLLEAFRGSTTVKSALTRPEQLVERIPRRLHPAERALVQLLT